MGDGVGPDLSRNVDLDLGDQRAGDGGAQQVLALIERIGAEHREHEVAHELLAQVLDEDVLGLHAQQQRLVARRSQLLALAEVGGEGHHLAAVGLHQPFQDDGGVESAGVGEHDLLGGRQGGHWGSFEKRRSRALNGAAPHCSSAPTLGKRLGRRHLPSPPAPVFRLTHALNGNHCGPGVGCAAGRPEFKRADDAEDPACSRHGSCPVRRRVRGRGFAPADRDGRTLQGLGPRQL